MKVKMMLIALGVALLMVTQPSAGNCGPCDPVHPCSACDSCCAKPCDLFAGLKNLLKSRPSCGSACAPCDPVVACGPCDTGCGPQACEAACADNAGCDPCGAACNTGCNHGCPLFKGLFSWPCHKSCGACDPAAACGACDQAAACGACDAAAACGACEPACGACGCNDCCCPGPLAQLLIKTRVGAKKLFKGFVGAFDCHGCGPCSAPGCAPCDAAAACGACEPACGACDAAACGGCK